MINVQDVTINILTPYQGFEIVDKNVESYSLNNCTQKPLSRAYTFQGFEIIDEEELRG